MVFAHNRKCWGFCSTVVLFLLGSLLFCSAIVTLPVQSSSHVLTNSLDWVK